MLMTARPSRRLHRSRTKTRRMASTSPPRPLPWCAAACDRAIVAPPPTWGLRGGLPMTDEYSRPGQDTGESTAPDDEALDGPGSGDLGSDTDESPVAEAPSTGKVLAQQGAEFGVKKATGSDVAVATLRGAQKARKGDITGGAQDVAASGIGAATALAVGSTGIGAPVAGLAGSAATSLAQTKAFRIAVVALAAIMVIVLVIQAAIIAAVSAAVAGARS